MAIKLNEIPPEGLTLNLAASVDLHRSGGELTAYTVTLKISRTAGASFRVRGRVKSSPILECSRCLRGFEFPIDIDFDFELEPSSVLGSEPEHELERSELDVDFYEGDEIDSDDIVREQILLALPMVPLHSEQCKGLCPVCGTDLNIADCGCKRDMSGELSPFSVLKDIFRK